MNNILTSIIVDDEALAREGLLLRLQHNDKIKVLGSFASATEAKLSFDELQPDLIFLDIEMPGISGLQFAQWLKQNKYSTRIVFVTAFKEFALDAFDFEAFDYLLKPYADDRLESCINKLHAENEKQRLAQQQQELNSMLINKTGDSLNTFMANLQHAEPGKLNEVKNHVSFKSGTEWIKLQLASIYWIEAAGDYMCVHTQDGTHIIRKTMKELQEQLCNDIFKRVSRSAIINTELMKKLTPNSNGEYIAQLRSGDNVKVSRKYKNDLLPE
ncbi:response regulator transcription factor [Glaciecola sp. MH2013]|uniref:LytR/AlgR family response regulator transcription factor n=1 Tax=Glaciecola sp. MH2013 TaxID=2785524 RepID=UPI0018A05D89|nr:LytTR family DNA-binding domain-containing protein [Glaciecola sp. MH2013]MBF7074667.1 response regulator transcription factor [Glaciecola sp. MH2013]